MNSLIKAFLAAFFLIATTSGAAELPIPASKDVEPLRLAQGNPPAPGCTRKCNNVRKCTPGPCEKRGSELVCKPEVCTVVESCGWECPRK
jgi:hypothetical protein